MSIPVSSLILSAQAAADMVNSPFVDTPTWIDWCDQAHKQLYGKAFQAFQDTFYKATVASGSSPPTSFPDYTLANGVGNNIITLPSDFRAIRGLFVQDPDQASRKNIPKFNFGELTKFRNGSDLASFGPSSQTKAYRVVSRSTLIMEPPENCGGTYRLYYVNGPLPLTQTTDTIMPELEPWVEYISQAMARKALLKEESDISAVDQRMSEIMTDMLIETETDENQVDSVVDVEADAGFGWSRRVW